MSRPLAKARLPRRVAMLHPAFDRPGGAENNVAAFSRALLEQGWAVEIVTARWNADAFEGLLDGFRPRLVPRPRAGLAGGVDRSALVAIEAAIGDCDAAMAHNYPFSAYLGHARAALPKIWYCQEPQRRIHAAETSPGLQRGIAMGKLDTAVPVHRQLTRSLGRSRWMRRLNPRHRGKRHLDFAGIDRIDSVWANSLATARQFHSLYGRAAEVFYMAVDVPETLPPQAMDRRPLRVLTMGGFGPAKGFALLLRGFAEFCRRKPGAAVLEIVGSTSGQSEFMSEVAARGIVDSVCFRGRLSQAALAQLRRQCHVFAAAPVDEPFGLVFAEAAAAGLVLIAPDHGGPREIALDGRGGVLIDIFDPQNIAAAFDRVLELSTVEREQLRQEAFTGTKTRFDQTQLGPRLACKLEALLDRSGVMLDASSAIGQ